MSAMNRLSEQLNLLLDQVAEEVIKLAEATSPTKPMEEDVINLLDVLNIEDEVSDRVRGIMRGPAHLMPN